MILEVEVLDTLQIDTPEHRALKHLSKTKYEHFAPILATKIVNEKHVQLLTIEKLEMFCRERIVRKGEAIPILFNILQSLWYLHQKEYFTGNVNLESLFLCNSRKEIKMKYYKAIPIKEFSFENINKDKNLAVNGIEFCFDFEKSPVLLDVWKWGVLAAQTLFNFSLETYIDKALLWDKTSLFETGLKIDEEFLGAVDLMKMINRCLCIEPSKRPKIAEIFPTFEIIIANIHIPLSEHIHKTEETFQSILPENPYTREENISENILLTDEIKKKLVPHFIKAGSKQPKSYKQIFRAKSNNFSPSGYYEQCHDQSQLLLIIDTVDSGIICCYLDFTIILIKTAGIAGQFIKDSNMKSFIFSMKNQDSYKIVNKDKAYKSVPGQGPIIGDGDIVLTNNGQNNFSNFPKSYQSPKIKKQTLTLKPYFNINNYDVYKVSF